MPNEPRLPSPLPRWMSKPPKLTEGQLDVIDKMSADLSAADLAILLHLSADEVAHAQRWLASQLTAAMVTYYHDLATDLVHLAGMLRVYGKVPPWDAGKWRLIVSAAAGALRQLLPPKPKEDTDGRP